MSKSREIVAVTKDGVHYTLLPLDPEFVYPDGNLGQQNWDSLI